MKYILTLLILFALPAFATCSLDNSKPCQQPEIQTDPNPMEESNMTIPYYNDLTMPQKTVTNNASDYNSNCQFGICLPESDKE